ncbi:MAG: hypothetical protein L6Q54_08815 [Leptospiraceae bacterium]|uniref:hypothetical protein n=1 Tax=Flavobacterium sp. TaxID=239 RepID=UPI0025C3DB62|nr:hypothetical protein [Flavobacterium sp.]MBE7411523.1 hypothetical protein [Leptospiraceae bacterium]MCK6381335.1 hypothetical protein [Leptospiraceae bacterium]MCK6609331.1 hypothetical protein [Flavobacterium sp.]
MRYVRQYIFLLVILAIAISCGHDEQNSKVKKEVDLFVFLTSFGILAGVPIGCEGQVKGQADFIPEPGMEMTIELNGLVSRAFRLQNIQNKNVNITYIPIDANCIFHHYGYDFCNGLFKTFPTSIKCFNANQSDFNNSDFINFTMADGPKTCKIDLTNIPTTIGVFHIGINYKSPATKCKISVLIQYE